MPIQRKLVAKLLDSKPFLNFVPNKKEKNKILPFIPFGNEFYKHLQLNRCFLIFDLLLKNG